MTERETAPADSPKQENRTNASVARARRLYDAARAIEILCADERGKELARNVALMALDLLAEARVGVAA